MRPRYYTRRQRQQILTAAWLASSNGQRETARHLFALVDVTYLPSPRLA